MPDRQHPPAGHRQRQGRNGEHPLLAVPEPRALLLDRLRSAIRAIEGHARPATLLTPSAGIVPSKALSKGTDAAGPTPSTTVESGAEPVSVVGMSPATTLWIAPPSGRARGQLPSPQAPRGAVWTLGAAEIDGRLGPAGLAVGGVHEIKAGLDGPNPTPGDFAADAAAALGFALRLVLCRQAMHGGALRQAPILWCETERDAGELGRLSAPGLAALGLDPAALVLVETARASETLWAIEEGLRSRAFLVVAGRVDRLSLTAARRLSLAAAAQQVACLLLTHPRAPPAAATETRWRVGRAPSAAHPFDPGAPGAPRWHVQLERCRRASGAAESPAMTVEWSDETHRFRVAAGMGDRARAARRA